MADGTSNVQVVFEAVNKAQSVLDDLKKSLGGLKSEQDKLGTSAASLGASQSSLGKILAGVNSEFIQQAQSVRVAALAMQLLPVASRTAVAALVTIAVAMVAATKSIADYQEKMDLAAESTGLTTGQLAGLKVAASESGRSFEQIKPGLDFFTRKIGEVAAGTPEAVKKFFDLGIAIRDTNGAIRPTGDIFKDAQAKLSSMGTAAERSTAAMDLFGRSGAASISILLTPLDEAEAKARKLGLALGPDAERVARSADAAFDMLGTSMQGIGNAFGVTAATILKDFLPALAKAASQTAEFMNMKKSNDWLGNLGRGFAWAATGGSPQSFSSAISGMAPGATEGKPYQWGVPEGNRPWGAQAGDPEAPKDAEAIAAALKEAAESAKLLAEIEKIKSAQYWRAEDAINAPPKFKIRGGAPSGKLFQGAGKDFATIPSDLTDEALDDAGKMAHEREKKLKKAADDEKRIIDNLFSGLESSFSSFISDALRGVGSLSDAFDALVSSVLDQIIQTGVSALFASVGLQGGGTVLAAQSGGTAAVHDGFVHAQSGVNMSGVRGFDSVPVKIGFGETILSNALTNKMDRMAEAVLGSRQASGSPGAGQPIEVNLNFGEKSLYVDSGMADPMFVREFAAKLIPEIGRAVRYGMA